MSNYLYSVGPKYEFVLIDKAVISLSVEVKNVYIRQNWVGSSSHKFRMDLSFHPKIHKM